LGCSAEASAEHPKTIINRSRYVASHGQKHMAAYHRGRRRARAVVGALFSSGIRQAILVLARARAWQVKYVPVEGAELYTSGVPMDEAQFRAAFVTYRAELAALPPPAERDAWQQAQANAACQRLAVITGIHPSASPASATQTTPGRGTGTTIPTPPPACRAATASGCCRQATWRSTEAYVISRGYLRTGPTVPPRLWKLA
jgi:hypothetical protein